MEREMATRVHKLMSEAVLGMWEPRAPECKVPTQSPASLWDGWVRH